MSETNSGGRSLLTHPLYLVSLATLVANDHWLKGADLLPGWLTGKLSDFAGLVVAVGLVGVLLPRARVAAGVVVAVTFCAINISSVFALSFQDLMATVGIPWLVTVDPTDLIALLVVPPVLIWVHRAPRRGWAFGRATVAGAAALACMATSPPPPEEGPPFQFNAEVGVFNSTDRQLTLRIRELRPDVVTNCFDVSAEPDVFLSRDAFGAAQTWTMEADSQVAAWSGETRECYAVLLEVDGMVPTLVFWDDLPQQPRQSPVQSTSLNRQTVVLSESGGVLIAEDADAGVELVFGAVSTFRPEPSDACLLPNDSETVAWSIPIPAGTHILADVVVGDDDCVRLDLTDGDSAEITRWYICLPAGVFPFVVGDEILIADYSGSGGGSAPGSFEGVNISLEPDLNLELIASYGEGMPEIHGILAGYRASTECVATLDECGTYTIPGELRVELGETSLSGAAGDSLVVLDATNERLDVSVVYAGERFIADPTCGTSLGVELQVVTIYRSGIAE